MAAYVTGYDDERFQHPVGQSLHCCICTNVFRDPVMCRRNEHIFCRACITRYLTNSQTCPTCVEPLTVNTLIQATRNIRNILSELKIRCEFFDRGCEVFINLADLETHVRECGFAPVSCSNEGCQLEMNKRDLLHHETTVCEHRRVKCHSCNDIRQKVGTIEVHLTAISEKMDINQENVKAVKTKLLAKVELVQEQLNKKEESNRQLKASNRQLEADNVEIKKSLTKIAKQLEKITQQTSRLSEQEKMIRGMAESLEMKREPKVVVAGGWNEGPLDSVEMFCLPNGTWTPLQPLRECRDLASSVVYNNEMIVLGGSGEFWTYSIKSIEKLSLNSVQADQSVTWNMFPAELSREVYGHCSIVYNGRLIVIRGWVDDEVSDRIIEVSLVPPYISKLLITTTQKSCLHGAALFDDKIVILGGRENWNCKTNLKTVLSYNITNNKCQKLAPLPYPVSRMATVKWGEDNVIIMGGQDSNDNALNTVLMYNVKTQKSHMLPDMKYKRSGCVAAAVKDTIIVMGGADEKENELSSVESFRFDRNTWEELPAMHEARQGATAIVW